MALNTTIYFTKSPRFAPTVFTPTDTTTAKQIFAPSADGSRLTGIIITSTSATARTVLIQINNGSVISKLGHITVPSGAGTNGSVAAVSGLNTANLPWLYLDANGNPFVDLNYNMNIEAKMLTTLASGEEIDVVVSGADYTA